MTQLTTHKNWTNLIEKWQYNVIEATNWVVKISVSMATIEASAIVEHICSIFLEVVCLSFDHHSLSFYHEIVSQAAKMAI